MLCLLLLGALPVLCGAAAVSGADKDAAGSDSEGAAAPASAGAGPAPSSESTPDSGSTGSGSTCPGSTGSGSGSAILFGQVITSCTQPNAIALTFDDGPHIFTERLLDTLKRDNIKATFFVNGENFAKISEQGALLQRMLAEGHQIGSHTNRHPDLTKISEEEVRSNMTVLDNELVRLVGKSPTYMRPPFFSTDDRTRQILAQMQYHIINADIDTKDFEFNKPETNDQAFQNFQREFQETDKGSNGNKQGTISLMHDVHQTTVEMLVPKAIELIKQSGRQAMTVGECLGDPPANLYRCGPVGGQGGRGGRGGRGGQGRRPGTWKIGGTWRIGVTWRKGGTWRTGGFGKILRGLRRWRKTKNLFGGK